MIEWKEWWMWLLICILSVSLSYAFLIFLRSRFAYYYCPILFSRQGEGRDYIATSRSIGSIWCVYVLSTLYYAYAGGELSGITNSLQSSTFVKIGMVVGIIVCAASRMLSMTYSISAARSLSYQLVLFLAFSISYFPFGGLERFNNLIDNVIDNPILLAIQGVLAATFVFICVEGILFVGPRLLPRARLAPSSLLNEIKTQCEARETVLSTLMIWGIVRREVENIIYSEESNLDSIRWLSATVPDEACESIIEAARYIALKANGVEQQLAASFASSRRDQDRINQGRSAPRGHNYEAQKANIGADLVDASEDLAREIIQERVRILTNSKSKKYLTTQSYYKTFFQNGIVREFPKGRDIGRTRFTIINDRILLLAVAQHPTDGSSIEEILSNSCTRVEDPAEVSRYDFDFKRLWRISF